MKCQLKPQLDYTVFLLELWKKEGKEERKEGGREKKGKGRKREEIKLIATGTDSLLMRKQSNIDPLRDRLTLSH